MDKHQATSRFFNQALNEACLREWRLLTHRKVNNLAEASEIVEWYRCRWAIEAFFNGLKNGCQVEALPLENCLKRELALSVYRVGGWRTRNAWAEFIPTCPPTRVLSGEEWKAACLPGKKKPPLPGEVIRQMVSTAVSWVVSTTAHRA